MRPGNLVKVFLVVSALLLSASVSWAVSYGGVEFPQGASSFADAVLQYNPAYGGGNVPFDPNYMDPNAALGIPNYSAPTGSVSLGAGGLIQLLFVDNVLTNSGDASLDLHVFEIGPDVEDTFVAIRPTASTLSILNAAGYVSSSAFFDIGKVYGATDSIDIDSIFTGFSAGVLLFDAVQLIDDIAEGDAGANATVGADIDAVGAITSRAQTVVPEPGTIILLGSGLLGLAGYGRKRR